MSALPSWGRRLAPSRKALPFLLRSYGLMRQAFTLPSISGTPLFERSLQVAASPCRVKALPNAISVVLPYVPGPLLQLLPRCCFPFLPLGHWPSPSEHGSALGFAPPLLLRMVKILELQSFHYVPAHRFVRLTGSSYPHTSQCRAAETFPAAHITVGYLPRAAAMLSTQTGQLVVRGLAPLRSDRLVGYSVRYTFIVVDFHLLLLAGVTGASL